MKKMFIKLVLFFALVALLIFTAFYSGIVVRHYTLDSKVVKDGRGMRIALISDLHGYIYGDKQDVLIKKLAGQNPDLVVMAGDMVDKDTTLEATRLLCEGFKDLSPTVPITYVVGNHESDLDDVDEIKNSIRKFGVTVLEDECLRFNLNGTNVLISGVQSPYISHVKKVYSSYEEQIRSICGQERLQSTGRTSARAHRRIPPIRLRPHSLRSHPWRPGQNTVHVQRTLRSKSGRIPQICRGNVHTRRHHAHNKQGTCHR